MTAPDTRQFSVHARHLDNHHARVLAEGSFEAAAVAYAEDIAHAALEGDQISVIVRELASGHVRCFQIDLHTGETEPCGDGRTK